jgi:gliding motility-associated peptidyl-prolyl isomerase
MNLKNFPVIVFLFSLLIVSCKQHQEARRPVSQASGSFMKKSIERNKKLIAGEEEQIQAIIKSDTTIKYIPSSNGYWYSYVTQNKEDILLPKKGDVAFFDYEIKDLEGNIIYSQLELKPQTYYVDKQNVMMGIRNGIKLMHKNEKVIFLFPSHMGFGYHGDNKKIGTNQPLQCTITLRDFMPEVAYKDQSETATIPSKSIEKPAPITIVKPKPNTIEKSTPIAVEKPIPSAVKKIKTIVKPIKSDTLK